MYFAAIAPLWSRKKPGSDFVILFVTRDRRGHRPQNTIWNGLRCFTDMLGELRTPKAATRRQKRDRIEEVCFACAIGARQHDGPAAQREFGAEVGAEVRERESGYRQARKEGGNGIGRAVESSRQTQTRMGIRT